MEILLTSSNISNKQKSNELSEVGERDFQITYFDILAEHKGHSQARTLEFRRGFENWNRMSLMSKQKNFGGGIWTYGISLFPKEKKCAT